MTTTLPHSSQPIPPTCTSRDSLRPTVPSLASPRHSCQTIKRTYFNTINNIKHSTFQLILYKPTQLSIFDISLPRLHVKPRRVDGSCLVLDRASDQLFQIYTPRFISQFRAGYRYGFWYLRRTGDLECSPRSPGFPTAQEAIAAIQSSRWDSSPTNKNRLRSRCKVSWS